MKFSKMQAYGNDYIYIDATKEKIDEPNYLAQKLCDRHFGIGSDGLVLAQLSKKADLKMRIFNVDGSEAEMCGNALRSIAKFAYLKKLVLKKELEIETLGGIKKVKLEVEGDDVVNIIANIGKPIWDSAKIPVLTNKETFINEEIKVLDKKFKVSALSWGNPHLVVMVEDLDNLEITKYGPALENYLELFPKRTNVTFLEIKNKNYLRIREWERGCSETWGCATGCASGVVVAYKLGLANREVEVEQRGGIIKIIYDENEGLTMIGPSTLVYEGEINL